MTTKVTKTRMNRFQKWKTMIMMALLLPISGALMAQSGTPISSANIGNNGSISITADGDYYISDSIIWNSSTVYGIVISANVTLDLNGNMLNGNSKVEHVIQVTSGHTLTLVDSDTTKVHKGTFGSDGLWQFNNTGSDIIKGGLITGGKTVSGSGKVGGGGVHLLGGNLIMESGTIAGNTTTTTSDGAGVRIQSANNNHPYFEMRGGKIYGNLAQQSGGAVYIATSSASSFVMTGGEISYNTAKNKDNNNNPSNGGGGGIYTDNGNHSITIQGGRIVNNTSPGKGSNIGVNNSSSSLLVTGGTITNNSGSNDIYFNGNTFRLGDATVGSVYLASEKYPVKIGEWTQDKFPSLYYNNVVNGHIIASGSVYEDVIYFVQGDWEMISSKAHGLPTDNGNILLSDGTADYWIWDTRLLTGNNTVKVRRDGVIVGEYNTVTQAVASTNTIDNDEIVLTANTEELYTIGVSKKLTLTTDGSDHTVVANCATRLVNIGTGRLTLKNGVTLDANGQEQSRNVMQVEENGTFIMEGGTLTKGYVNSSIGGRLGGAIQNYGTIQINGGEICYNTVASAGDGGAIRCEKGTITMSGGSIHHNQCGGNGGAISMRKGTFVMSDGSIYNNKTAITEGEGSNVPSDMRGGAVFVNRNTTSDTDFATMNMSGGEIYGNQAEGDGGAIYALGDFNMQGGSIHENQSKGNGGGVFLNRMSVFSGCTIKDNTAALDGGGVYVGVGTLVARFTGVTIQDNVATNGNGVFSKSSKLSISGQVNLIGNDLFLANGITLKKDGPLDFESMEVIFSTPVSNGRKLLVGGAAEVESTDLGKFSASPIPDGSALKFNEINKDIEVMSTTGTDYVTVTFHANNGTGETVDQDITSGVPTALNPCGFSNASTPFRCWNDNVNGNGTSNFVDQQVVTLSGNLDLYAQWGDFNYIYFDLAAMDITIDSVGGEIKYFGGIYKTDNGGEPELDSITGTHDPLNHYYVYQSTDANRHITGLVNGSMQLPDYHSVVNHGEGINIVNDTNVQEVINNWNDYGAAVGRTPTTNCISVDTVVSNFDFVFDNIWSTKQEYEKNALQASSFKVDALNTYNPEDHPITNLRAIVRLKGENRLAKVMYLSPDNISSNSLTFTSAMGNGSDEGILIAGTVIYSDSANYWSSAIGGCNHCKPANGLVFNGGTIYALSTPGDYCVAIGGGSNGYGGVTINGGTVTAVSSTTAIGGGAGETKIGGDANIVINGGKVYAYNLGGVAPEQQEVIPCAAIGGGSSIRAGGNAISHVEINGGEVYAESHGGVGIGGGSSSDLNGGPVSIRINGGEIEAKSFDVAGLPVGTGIGGGTGGRYGNGGDAILYITGGTINTGSVGGGGTSNVSGSGHIGAANVEITGDPTIKAQFLMQLGSTTHCSFNMSGGTISGSYYDDTTFVHLRTNGGAVWMDDRDGMVTITGGTITDCSAENGGAVYMTGGSFEMEGGTIELCQASNKGGAVYMEGGTFEMTGGTIGGATIEEGNKAITSGGGVYVAGTGTFTMNGGNIQCNKAESEDGGGIYVESGNVTLEGTNVVISGNSANQNGGGLYTGGGDVIVDGGAQIGINGTESGSGNSAEYGGGLFVNGGHMTFSEGTIGGNSATMQGGGIYINQGAELYLKGEAVITGNHVPTPNASEPNKGKGGGVYLGGSLYVGEDANDPLGAHKLRIDDNYAGETYQYDIVNKTNNRNNVYLPSFEKVITLLSDISNINSKETVETHIGFSVDQGFKPVIKVLEDNQTDWLDHLMPHQGTALTGAIFDDKEKYVAVNGINNDNLQIYLWGCWTTLVNTDPEGTNAHEQYPLPTGVTAHYTIDGQGTWHIFTSEGLSWFSSYVNGLNAYANNPNRSANAVLENDVNMDGFLWVPIGAIKKYYPSDSSFEEDPIDVNETYYTGNFDGQGHVIANLECGYLTGINRFGLFGAIKNGAVTNTFLDHFNITQTNPSSKYKSGSIAGIILGETTISNCEARGLIVDDAHADWTRMGGLVGEMNGASAKMHSCSAMPEFSGNNLSKYNLGGLVGVINSTGKLSNCFSNVKVGDGIPGSDLQLGGLAGYSEGTVENCYVHMQDGSVSPTPSEFAWFVGYLTGNDANVRYCYAPYVENPTIPYIKTNNTGDAALTGHGTYGATSRDEGGKYNFAHSDQLVTATNDYVDNGAITNTGELKGLLATLNNWVEAQNDGVDYSTWTRTMASPINDDYPILEFNDFVCAGSTDGVFIAYKNDLDEMIAYANGNTAGGNIYPYGLNSVEVGTSTRSNVRVYIPGDMAVVPDNDNVVINARVGVTLDNSSTGFMAYDWHMFSPALADASMGIDYYKNIFGYDEEVPNDSITLTGEGYLPSNTGFNEFDFYTYYEPEYHWINFKRKSGDHWHADGGAEISYQYWNGTSYTSGNEPAMVPGKGYLMAVNQPTMLMADGVLNNGEVTVGVFCEANGYYSYPLQGVNLVGNPYQSYLNFDTFANDNGIDAYYILDADAKGYIGYAANQSAQPDPSEGSDIVAYSASKYLHPHQGFFVKVGETGTVSFDNSMRVAAVPSDYTGDTHFRGETPNYPLVSMACTDKEGRNDFATVELNRPEQGGGKKIKGLHAGDASLWFHFDDTDYQTAFTTPGLTTAPLRFKAYEDGTFTLRWGTANGEFNYLHLIDNMTGMDIDCLTTESYSFEGKTDDYTSRFKLVFGMPGEDEDEDDGASTGSATFAFQMGDELVVNGEGMLQMFDVNGRCLMSTELYGQQNTISLPTAAAGVYVLRLTSGENVKVQKMVVR